MLFSHGAVADFLNANFECAWESVRPVPRVEIDFGNGRRLSRTLNGNVATYFCSPGGRVFDIVPGLAEPEDYLERAQRAADLHRQLGARWDVPGAGVSVAHYHGRMRDLESTPPGPGSASEIRLRLIPDFSKSSVEVVLKRALAPWPPHGTARVDLVKGRVENPLKASLREDAEYNRTHRDPKVHDLLADRPLATPAEVTATVYRDILGVDLEDPYLGLAPYVLGGEIGRH